LAAWTRIRLRPVCDLGFDDVNGKVRTKEGAQTAVSANGISDHLGGVIPLGIGTPGQYKYIAGAKFNAKAAPFAALFDNPHCSAGNGNEVCIEWGSPELHDHLHSPESIRLKEAIPIEVKHRKDPRGRITFDPREFLKGLRWILGTGVPWKDLPPG